MLATTHDLWTWAIAELRMHYGILIFVALAAGITLMLHVISCALERRPPAQARQISCFGRAATRIAHRPKWVTLPGLFLCVWALTALGVYCEERSNISPNSRAEFHYGYQIFTGNWSSPPYIDQDPKKYPKPFKSIALRLAISTSFAIVLNLAALGTLGWAFQRITKIWSWQMLYYKDDLAALKGVERAEVMREVTAYLKDRKLIDNADEQLEGLEDRIDIALTRSRVQHRRLHQIAYGQSRAGDIESSELG